MFIAFVNLAIDCEGRRVDIAKLPIAVSGLIEVDRSPLHQKYLVLIY